MSSPLDAVETWHVLAVRVSFPLEDPDDETTSGNGTFDLRSFEEVRDEYTFPYGIPPHDRFHFEAHLQALSNYYREVSQGQLNITYAVYPRDPQTSYQLTDPLKEYGNGRTRQEIAERITQLFQDGIEAADLAEGNDLNFGEFDAFAVFHAGLGAEAGQQAPNDIPSAFINLVDLQTYGSGPIAVDNGTTNVASGMLLPEAISADGPVVQGFANGAVVNTGDWGAAAGDDAEVNTTETHISTGDILIGNTTVETHIADSFNDMSTNSWTEYEMEIDDSFNDFSDHTEVEVEIEDAFNEFDSDVDNDWEWENNGNVFSDDSAVIDDINL